MRGRPRDNEGRTLDHRKDAGGGHLVADGLTGVEALHAQRQPRLGDGDELQGDVELAPPKVTQTGGAAQLCDLNGTASTWLGQFQGGGGPPELLQRWFKRPRRPRAPGRRPRPPLRDV